jgi:hypothetical protein
LDSLDSRCVEIGYQGLTDQPAQMGLEAAAWCDASRSNPGRLVEGGLSGGAHSPWRPRNTRDVFDAGRACDPWRRELE